MTTGLLREDGTSVSILMAMEDIESDMNTVSGLLRKTDVSTLTQTLQNDIVESLKQLIEAAQKEMEQMKEQQQGEPKDAPPSEKKPPLVALIAEIKVLRALQVRVNRRTIQIDQMMQATTDAEQRKTFALQLTDLAVRQRRLVDSARELSRQMEPH